MPLPKPSTGESREDFIDRCMSQATEFDDIDQRYAVCVSQLSGKKASQDDIDARYSEYHDTVNMSASELERWSETECSKLASVDRSPIARNLKLLRTKKEDWGDDEYKSAGRTISFVSRMRGNERGEPASEGCPSKRDISLKNWAYDPNKKNNNMENIESTKVDTLPTTDSEAKDAPDGALGSLYQYKNPTQTKSFGFLVKDAHVDEDAKVAIIKGYGAVFGNVDLGNDIISRGAFKKTLNDKGNKVYFLADHKYDTDNILGIAEVQEDEVGLYGVYKLNLQKQKARDAYSDIKMAQDEGIPLGMSIGFDIIDSEMDTKSQVRVLKELRLHEISLTPFPMNESARVLEAKSKEELVQMRATIDSLLKSQPSDSDTDSDEADDEQIENLIKSIQDVRKKIDTRNA